MNRIEEINREINECYAMIDHFIALKKVNQKLPHIREKYEEEIKYWRKALQMLKFQKRGLKNS
ncbi:MAG: hypothetical protein IJN92_09965 [Lachnospiraceae bacterium]|nr:hypothetical protein [Lachnospiraceae bacterium]